MKKGFTLIELLAVIVILAIIALIATPIVLNIINDTKESAQLRSAEMYLDGVEQAIMKANMKGTFNPNICDITDGSLLCDDKPVMVDIKGEKPTDGTITFQNGKINEVNLYFENGKLIVKDEKGKLVYGVTEEKICTLNSGETAMAIGAAYTCDPGDGEKRTFYLLEKTSTTVSLLMNENIEGPITWGEANTIASNLETTWQAVSAVKLPTKDQIYAANGNITTIDPESWLVENLVFPGSGEYPGAYFTSTKGSSSPEGAPDEYSIFYVVAGDSNDGNGYYGSSEITEVGFDPGNTGLRPVITIPIDGL